MSAHVSKNFDRYTTFLYGYGSNPPFSRVAEVNCFHGHDFMGQLTFYREGSSVPQNSYDWQEHENRIFLNFPVERFNSVMDVLRIERPLYLWINIATKVGYVGTSALEPVGEERVLPELARGNTDDELKTIRLIINRHPVGKRQQALFRVLYRAGDNPLSKKNLAAAMDCTERQLTGILGGLGRRINSTPGVDGKPGILFMFEVLDYGEWHYKMREELQEVLESDQYEWLKTE